MTRFAVSNLAIYTLLLSSFGSASSLYSSSASLSSSSSTASFSSSSSSSSSLPQCHFPTTDLEFAKYHRDDACDLAYQNSPELLGPAMERKREIMQESPMGMHYVPAEKTVTCPSMQHGGAGAASAASLYPSNREEVYGDYFGMHTSWLVENTSKVPIVIAFVDFQTGEEFSAVDAEIQPPYADPNAILMPHEWTSVWTMEGHVFHVYELLGEAGNFHLGRLVLQHRVGIIPIQTKSAASNAATNQCDDDTASAPIGADEEEDEEAATATIFSSWKNERCHELDRTFRNMVGCPVNVYDIGRSAPPVVSSSNNGNADELSSTSTTCAEDFKFRLGVNSQAVDFEHDPNSAIRADSSFIGHTFVFRLASNPNVVVGSYTLTPTYVVDCPGDDETVTPFTPKRALPVAEAVVMPSGTTTGTATTELTVVDSSSKTKVIVVTTRAIPIMNATRPLSSYDCHMSSSSCPNNNAHHATTPSSAAVASS